MKLKGDPEVDKKRGVKNMAPVDEFQCLLALPNLGEYIDKWIAVVGDEIIAVSGSGFEVYRKAVEAHPDATPMILKVPADRVT